MEIAQALQHQLEDLRLESRMKYDYHCRLMAGDYPLTIGGGIGQSRLCMRLIETAHIPEAPASLWDVRTLNLCAERGIRLF